MLGWSPAAYAARPGSVDPPPCPTNAQAFAPKTATEFQRALDCAEPGATIILAAGQLYEGNFTLRHKPVVIGADGMPKRITIKSDRLDTLLQQVPQRVGPSDESNLAWLKVPTRATAPVVSTDDLPGLDGTRGAASHYRFAGIKFFTSHWVNRLVKLGTGDERVLSEFPDDITFDRCYFAGSPTEGTKQGLVANGQNIVVTNSYLQDFKDVENDAQAIIFWNGSGPFHIENNYLEASGENLMVGGGDPTIPDLVPSDITIRGNHFFKPPRWVDERARQRGVRGRLWRVKNLFELKNAQRVLFEGNVLENNWIQADQHGFAVLLSTRNQDGGCPWCRIQDVTMSNNLIKNSTAGMKFLLTDDTVPSGQLRNVLVQNNVFVNINADALPGTDPGDRAGRLIQIMNPSNQTVSPVTGPVNLTIDHNTAFSSREFSFSIWEPAAGVTFTNNVARHNPCSSPTSNNCGISGEGTAPGEATFAAYLSAPLEIGGNILFAAGDRAAQYARFPTNSFPDSVTFRSAIDLTTGNPAAGGSGPVDYTLVADDGSPVLAHDGKRAGADWEALKPMLDAAVSGTLFERDALPPAP